eukprot:TRINITY_DN7874_c0_g1_i3.p1 TRINITY_DN7874_c0_g1~~TRINITY_DN7874_c0_g1_i3.p1  ORF type:complete len:1384 (+),score=162.36 TRINITY_DN7874_c0_g1_i3:38-4153(+)
MVSWRFVAVTACYFFLAHGIRLDGPIHANDLMQHNVDQCLTGQIVRDTTFISTTLAALRPEGDKIIKRNKEDVVRDWHHVQTEAATWLQDTDESARKVRESNPPHVLIAQAVKGADVTINRVKANMEHLLRSKYGVFKWAFFHYDGRDMWEHYDWYNASPDIVRREIIPVGGCEESHYRRLSVKDTHDFDYIWLMDDDIDLTFLDWDLYATVLASSQSMISQPAILSGSFTGRTSDVPGLTMVPASNGELLIMSETHTSEVMTPLISTKLWPAIQARLLSKVTKCDSDINMFWDLVAFLGRIYCNFSAVTVLNAAPVSHVDCKSMANAGFCSSDCDADSHRPIDLLEAELMREVCKNIPSDWIQRYGCETKSLTDCLANVRSAAFVVQPKQLRLRVHAPTRSLQSSGVDLSSRSSGVASPFGRTNGSVSHSSGIASTKGSNEGGAGQNAGRVLAQPVGTMEDVGQPSGVISRSNDANVTNKSITLTAASTPIGAAPQPPGAPDQSSGTNGARQKVTTRAAKSVPQDDTDGGRAALNRLISRAFSPSSRTTGARQNVTEQASGANTLAKGSEVSAQARGAASQSSGNASQVGGASVARQDERDSASTTWHGIESIRGFQAPLPGASPLSGRTRRVRQDGGEEASTTIPATSSQFPMQNAKAASQSLGNASQPSGTSVVRGDDSDPTSEEIELISGDDGDDDDDDDVSVASSQTTRNTNFRQDVREQSSTLTPSKSVEASAQSSGGPLRSQGNSSLPRWASGDRQDDEDQDTMQLIFGVQRLLARPSTESPRTSGFRQDFRAQSSTTIPAKVAVAPAQTTGAAPQTLGTASSTEASGGRQDDTHTSIPEHQDTDPTPSPRGPLSGASSASNGTDGVRQDVVADAVKSLARELDAIRGLLEPRVPSTSNGPTNIRQEFRDQTSTVIPRGFAGAPGRPVEAASQPLGSTSHPGRASGSRQDDADSPNSVQREIDSTSGLRGPLPASSPPSNGSNGVRQDVIDPKPISRELEMIPDIDELLPGASSQSSGSTSVRQAFREQSSTTIPQRFKGAPAQTSGRQDDANTGTSTQRETNESPGLKEPCPGGSSLSNGTNDVRQDVTDPTWMSRDLNILRSLQGLLPAAPPQSSGSTSVRQEFREQQRTTMPARGVGAPAQAVGAAPRSFESTSQPTGGGGYRLDDANPLSREVELVRRLEELVPGTSLQSNGTNGDRVNPKEQLKAAAAVTEQLRMAIAEQLSGGVAQPADAASQSRGTLSQPGVASVARHDEGDSASTTAHAVESIRGFQAPLPGASPQSVRPNGVRQDVAEQSRTLIVPKESRSPAQIAGADAQFQGHGAHPSLVSSFHQDDEDSSVASISSELDVVRNLQELLRETA